MKTKLTILCALGLLFTACVDPIGTPTLPTEPVITEPSFEATSAPVSDDGLPDNITILSQLPNGAEAARVNFVVDGDTIEVNQEGTDYRVRYIGIDTPERDEACYLEATTANADFLAGRDVYLVRDVSETDRFDRLLRYIYVEVNGGFIHVNEALALSGYARSVEFPPDTSFADELGSAEDSAAAEGIGCWLVPGFNGF